MARKVRTISENDIEYIKNLEQRVRDLEAVVGRQKDRWPPKESEESPEVYIALTPAGGIAGVTVNDAVGTGSGYGDDVFTTVNCDLYKKLDNNLVALGYQKPVTNVSFEAIPEYTWIAIQQDKFGTWFTDRSASSGVEIGVIEIVDGVRGRDEIQLVDLSSGTASGGTFTIGYVTSLLPSNVTANIAWNASSSTVQTQVRTLLGWETATVTGSDINTGYTITNPVRTAYQALEIDDALLTGTTPVGQVTRTQESLRAVFDATLQTLTEPITDDQSFPFATGDSVWVRDLRDKWAYSGRSVLKVGRKYLAQRIGTDLYHGRPLYSIDSAGDQLSNHIRAYTTTTQNIVTGSYTKIEWDGVYEDTQSSWDAGNPTYFTLQDNSWLHDIHLTVYWATTANDGGSRLARLGSASSATDAIIVDGMPTELVAVPGFHTASTYGQVTQHEWKSVRVSQHNDKQIAIWLRTENNNLDITGAYLVIREVGFRPYPINLP